MTEEINASVDAIIDLTEEINNSERKVRYLSETLSSQLRTLGTTFEDEGFNTIQGYIARTQKKVEEANPDLDRVTNNLLEYAQRISESRNVF